MRIFKIVKLMALAVQALWITTSLPGPWTVSTMTAAAAAPTSFSNADESWLLEPVYRSQHNTMLVSLKQSITWTGVTYCLDNPPLKQNNKTTDDQLPTLSVCPWYYVINYDKNRDPPTLMAARCACSTCQMTGGKDHRCVPVHYFRNVTYSSPTGKVSKIVRLPVGCTCERNSGRG